MSSISVVDPNTLNIIDAQIGTAPARIDQNFSDPLAFPYDPLKISVVSYGNAIGAIHASLQGAFASSGEAINDIFGSNINGLIGTAYADRLGGNANANLLRGGAGNDDLWGMGGADTLEGGDGWDTASYSYATAGVTVNLGGFYGIANAGEAAGDVFDSIEGLLGSAHDDMLIGDAGDNWLEGGIGSDTLVGGAGADRFFGSFETAQTDSGIDVVTYEYAGSAIAFDMSYGNGTVGEAAGDRFSSIEKVIGSRFNDTMGGTAYVETLEGGEGDDVLAGHGGGDRLNGGNGYDFASYSRSTAAVQVNLGSAPDEAQSGGDAAGDTLVSIEGVIGSKYADILTGYTGNDTFDGWLGADIMTGGLGSDTYHVNEAGDQVIETAANDGIDLVITEIGYALGSNVESLTAKAGSSLATSLTGNALNNTIIGNEFANVINGGAGADTMMGGAGNDTYYMDDLGDTIVDTSGVDTVFVWNNHILNSAIENVVAVGAVSINLTGDAARNTVTGNAGNNKIGGGYGNDVLTGGLGRDAFVFNTKIGTYKTNKSVNYDRIVDFNVKDDSIHLDNAVFKKLGKKGSPTSPAKLNKHFFKVGASATDKDDYLVYNKKKGVLYYDVDGNGSKKVIEIMKFDNKPKLTAADFFVI